MLSFSTVTFSLSLLFSSYLSILCSSPPNPDPLQPYKHDRMGRIAGLTPRVIRRSVILCSSLYHALLALTFPSHDTRICPHPSNINPVLFTWNALTLGSLILIICVGAPIRLAAFSRLGKNFTFRLAPPDRLITTGIYRYVQHPSYTGQVIVFAGNFILLPRWDASLACWVPEHIIEKMDGWGRVVYGVAIPMMVWMLSVRVRDEETMLKEKFGASWEQWHRKTKRFIPGIF
ncbi:uncharacterized protein V1513DRAFT_454999 [Lipomyces chichibuensis]|uniref:uncharacterized protein n=1 Tax=Lipomyces chichibuensis TaxID=1546026 RepID=UPI0033436CA8